MAKLNILEMKELYQEIDVWLVFHGGIVAGSWGEFEGGPNVILCCYNLGNVSLGKDTDGQSYGAGICGYMNSESGKSLVSDCINYGDISVAGLGCAGIVADCNVNTNYVGEIIRCINLGKMTGAHAGSICGYVIGGKITNCFYYR